MRVIYQQNLKLLHPRVYTYLLFRRRCICKKIHFCPLNLNLTWIVVQYPLRHMTYASAKFAVTTPYILGGYAFNKNTLFELWPWSAPTTSCDVCPCIAWHRLEIQLQKKRAWRTHPQMDGQTAESRTTLIRKQGYIFNGDHAAQNYAFISTEKKITIRFKVHIFIQSTEFKFLIEKFCFHFTV